MLIPYHNSLHVGAPIEPRGLSYPVRPDHAERHGQQHRARRERGLPRPRLGDKPLAPHAAQDSHDAVDGAHARKRAAEVPAAGAQPARVEVRHHPALEDAEEQARADAAQDAAREQHGQGRDRGQEAGRRARDAEEEARGLAPPAVGHGPGDGARGGAREEARREQRRHDPGLQAVLVRVQRVQERALQPVRAHDEAVHHQERRLGGIPSSSSSAASALRRGVGLAGAGLGAVLLREEERGAEAEKPGEVELVGVKHCRLGSARRGFFLFLLLLR